jgi:DNA helicase-2/ATP-dependent DNA helicase PcrA
MLLVPDNVFSGPVRFLVMMKLTPQQRRVIRHRGSNLQTIANAGSGKTEVIARHAVDLLSPVRGKQAAEPRNVVAFTFTEKAAAELKARIQLRCLEENGTVNGLAEMFVGTIHGFCLDLLRSEVPKYLKFEVLNAVQQGLFVDRHSKTSGLTVCTDLNGDLLRRYVETKNYITGMNILREADLVQEEIVDCSLLSGLTRYKTLLDERGYFDYASIIEETVIALRTDPGLRQRVAGRVRHLIVDEYQDVNPIQEKLISLLHELGARLVVVGDDDQTIYQWRGSDVSNIITFHRRYPKVDQLTLDQNFRSTEGITETALAFIQQNGHRLPKAMRAAGLQEYEAGDIAALEYADAEEEAKAVAAACHSLRGVAIREQGGARGLAWSDMAVLLRSVRASGGPITRAFDAAGIPYIVVGMNELFTTAEALAARDLFYFMAGRITLEEAVLSWAHADTGATPAKLRKALREAEKARLAMALAEYKRSRIFNPQRQYLNFLETAEIREENVPGGRGEILMYNLGKFSKVLSDFETIYFHTDAPQKYDMLAKFLEYNAPNAYPEGIQDNAYANPDAVRIMTVHQAKGMEWPVVFLPQLTRNIFPMAKHGGRQVWHLLPREGIVNQTRFEGSIEEERRIFYVAMTRSQKFLYLSWAPKLDSSRYRLASEFWRQVSRLPYVADHLPTFSRRKRLPSQAKASVANVVLTFSDIKYFFSCPYQFKLRILYGFNPPIDEALGYGKSLHDILAEIHARALRGEDIPLTEVPSLVEHHLRLPYAYQDLRDTLRRSAEKVVADYLKANKKDFHNLEFSEKSIEISLGDGVQVIGRIDLVRRLDTDETSIVDFKSHDHTQSPELSDIQLGTYARGYQELTGRNADYLETYDLDAGKRKRARVDKDRLKKVDVHILHAAEALRLNRLPAQPTEQKCAVCDHRGVCASAYR